MNLKSLILPVALFALSACFSVQAESKVSEVVKEKTSVLKGAKFVKTPPKEDAKYYVLLYSASWCGPCQMEMPNIVKLYKRDFKKNPELELIHISADKNNEDALKWAKEVKAPFPVMLPEDKISHEILNQRSSGGIPHMVIVNAEGKKIASDHPAKLIPEIKKIIKKDQEENAETPAK